MGKLTVVPLYTSNDSYSNIIHLNVHVSVIMKRAANYFPEDTIICLNLFLSLQMVRVFYNSLKKWLDRSESLIQCYKQNTFREFFLSAVPFEIVQLEYILFENTASKHRNICVKQSPTPSVHYVLKCFIYLASMSVQQKRWSRFQSIVPVYVFQGI